MAKKSDTGAIVGYAAFLLTHDGNGCYLMRIAVRSKCQRHGIGRILVGWLRANYPLHLELDVSTDNERAIKFYFKVGLEITRKYISGDKVEFACF